VKQHLGRVKQSEVNVWFFLHFLVTFVFIALIKTCSYFFKYICKCSYKAQKWFASILKNGVPTFGFFKCLKLFTFFSHDTCRVSRLKTSKSLHGIKPSRAGFITFGRIIGFALLGLYSNKACRPIQKPSSPPPSCLGKERFSDSREEAETQYYFMDTLLAQNFGTV
jgi:hypothetical protein